MAGLFELQLPSQSRSRSSQDHPERRLSISNGKSQPPDATAREIVDQVTAKQDATAASSSIFPWKRWTTTQSPPQRTVDYTPRNSDVSSMSDSQSPERRRKLKSTRHDVPTSIPTSLSRRTTTTVELNLNSDQPETFSKPPHATSALAHAGLGLGLPPIAFPGQISPISPPPMSKTRTIKREAPLPPAAVHGNDNATFATLSFRTDQIRRVKSFTKRESKRGIDAPRSSSSANKLTQDGDVITFTPDRPPSATTHVHSAPERLLKDVDDVKGKRPASDANPGYATGAPRGRQSTSNPMPVLRERERSSSRRASWWPGRRRTDSSPLNPPPPPISEPPPIPQRSQARPGSIARSAPSLPTFRPISPLMDEFILNEIPGRSSFEDHGRLKQQGLDDDEQNPGEREATVRRRYSLSSRTEGSRTHVIPSSQPSGRPSSHSHRYSWSISLSSALECSPSSFPSRSPPIESSINKIEALSLGDDTNPARRRSMTINSPPISPPGSPVRDTTPLLLRHPTSRFSSTGSNPYPFASGQQAVSGAHSSLDTPDGGESSNMRVEMQRTPSTSSASTSSHSPSAPATRTQRGRAGTAPSGRLLATSSTSTSLPPSSSSSSSSNLLRRLSSTLLSSVSTPITPTLENSQTFSSSVVNLSVGSPNAARSSPDASDASSPRRSRENLSPGEKSSASAEAIKTKLAKSLIQLPGEDPEDYVDRLVAVVNKAEIAHVLAASGDVFHTQALRSYLERFNFLHDPLDIALRKLLMDVGLPRETQQIDRVVEAFAARYVECNPRIFAEPDHPYILAFSLIMLHTDAFNKSNKNKMSKGDYVKNARLPGVPSEVLECFFDNIVFAPFIFIEDATDMNPKGYMTEGVSRLSSLNVSASNATGTAASSGGSTILPKTNKIDPYYLIAQGLLGPLRVDVDSQIPPSNPYQFGEKDWDTRRSHLIFSVARIFHMNPDSPFSPANQNHSVSTISSPVRRKSLALPVIGVGTPGPFLGSPPFIPDNPSMPQRQVLGPASIRVAKVGVMARKEDCIEGGKRSTNRKWKEWSVVLTGSQLLFFRDINFASRLSGLPNPDGTLDPSPDAALLNPDEAVPLHQCIALLDNTYRKYENTFRFMMPTGRQFLCKVGDERSLNDWISTINYASAFRSAGVSMRGSGMSHKDVEMTGVAAAASHLEDLRASSQSPPQGEITASARPSATHGFEVPASRSQSSIASSRAGSSKIFKTLNGAHSQVDLELPMSDQLEGAQQLKATFDEVKAELAAQGRRQRPSTVNRTRTLSMGARPRLNTPPRPATAGTASMSSDANHSMTRNDIIQSRIDAWGSMISGMQQELDSDLRIARNFAILTPFQRTTRDRIQAVVGLLAKRVKNIRTELSKLTCYRFVLFADQEEEERHLKRVKMDALKAAAQRLSTEEGLASPSTNVEKSTRPVLHLRSQFFGPESGRNAVDGYGHLSATPLSMLSEDDTSEFPFLRRIHASASLDNIAALTRSSGPTRSNRTPSPVDNGHERFYTAAESPEEIAEEWNETRAAKRVSLVRLPSGVRLSSVFSNQMRSIEGVQQRDNLALLSQQGLPTPKR